MTEICYTLKLVFTFFLNKWHLSTQTFSGLVCTTPKSLKTLFNVEEFDKAGFAFECGRKTTELIENDGGEESHEYRDVFLKQKFKSNEVIVVFLTFSGVM